ncbi:MAG: AarF/ABC1/UbiB kinase family protein [Myxococcota bacterium]
MPGNLGTAIGDLRRLTEIVQTAMRFGFGPLMARAKLLEHAGLREPPVQGPSTDEPARVRFRSMLEALGPTFIKFGQILSSRPDLLPAPWITELEKLQDNCSPMTFDEFQTGLAAGLGKNPGALFREITRDPLASASIAQVHRAVTRDGRQVVLKVRRPGIKDIIRADMNILHYMAGALQAVVEEAGIYNPPGIVTEFEKAVSAELDFRLEARNIERFCDNFASSAALVIPRTLPEHCCENVICMEFIEGIKITDAGEGYNRETLAVNLLEASFKQVFEDGFFHADPHPGNILALPDNRVALLDFGQVGELTKTQKELLTSLALAIALKDSESIARLIHRAARSDKRVRLARLRVDIENLLDKYIDMELSAIKTGTLLGELVEVAAREGLRLPPQYAMLGKGSVTVSGIVRTLAPNLNVDAAIKPFTQKLLIDRYSSDSMSEALLKFGIRLFTQMQDIPLQLDQIVSDIEEGRLNIHVSGQSLEEAARNIRRAAILVGTLILSASFIVGGFVCVALGRDDWGVRGIVIGAATAALTMIWHVVSGVRMKKLSIRRYLGERSGPDDR